MGTRLAYNIVAFVLLAFSLITLPDAMVDGIVALTNWETLIQSPLTSFSSRIQAALADSPLGLDLPLWLVSLLYFVFLAAGVAGLYFTNISLVENRLAGMFDRQRYDDLETELSGFNGLEATVAIGGFLGVGIATAGLKAITAGAVAMGPPGWLIALGLAGMGAIFAAGRASEQRAGRIARLRDDMLVKIAMFRAVETRKLALAAFAVILLVGANFALPYILPFMQERLA